MKYTILDPFARLPYFTIEGFRQLAGEQVASEDHARVSLHRWIKAGHLIPIKKGVYMHARFYQRHGGEPAFLSMVSAIIQPQSYLSLEYILQAHNILTEITYPVTAVTVKNTHTITNPLGTFVYRHIQTPLYYGFSQSDVHGIRVSIAPLAKALFDYLYLRPNAGGQADINLAEEYRLNMDEVSPADRREFTGYVLASDVKKTGGAKMRRILSNLEKTAWQH